MLEFPWNKKNKNKVDRLLKQMNNSGGRTPYTLEQIDDFIKKYNGNKETKNGKKAEVTTAVKNQKEKLVIKKQPENIHISEATATIKDAPEQKAAEEISEPINPELDEKLKNGERIIFFEGEETNEEPELVAVSHPQLDEIVKWIKKELKDALSGIFMSDLYGERVYAHYGFELSDLKNLLLIPPVVDAELQKELDQGATHEMLFRTDKKMMLYYMDIGQVRMGLLLDETKLNMGMLFSIIKPAIEERVKAVSLD